MTIQLAANASEFKGSPEKFRGFIERRLKRQLDITVGGITYTMNAFGFILHRRKLENGKNWYTFPCSKEQLFERVSEEERWVQSFAVSRDSKGLIFK